MYVELRLHTHSYIENGWYTRAATASSPSKQGSASRRHCCPGFSRSDSIGADCLSRPLQAGSFPFRFCYLLPSLLNCAHHDVEILRQTLLPKANEGERKREKERTQKSKSKERNQQQRDQPIELVDQPPPSSFLRLPFFLSSVWVFSFALRTRRLLSSLSFALKTPFTLCPLTFASRFLYFSVGEYQPCPPLSVHFSNQDNRQCHDVTLV